MAMNLGEGASSVVVRSQMPASRLARTDEQLRNLIVSTRRTWPGSRSFGTSGDAVDSRLPSSVGVFAVELQEAVDAWIPGLSIRRVGQSFDPDGLATYELDVDWV